MIEYIFFIITIFLTNFLFKKNNFLFNSTGQSHQIYNQTNQVPLTGGTFILLFFFYNFNLLGFEFIFFLTCFFLLGLCADLNLIKSPITRFIMQIIFIILFVISFDVSLYDIRITWINNLLENDYFNIFFVSFCFLVLVNGSNFIDGNNGISLGYFLILFLIVLNLISNETIIYEKSLLLSFLIIIFVLLIFNLSNQLYLGDNGIYLLSLFTGYILIDLFNQNQFISPYFIVNLFWYPAFEILFSIIRKALFKYSPLKPDTSHFHQLLFYFFLKKLKLSKDKLNSFTGITIFLCNSIVMYIASNYIQNTKIQIILLLINLATYILCYNKLFKFRRLSREKKPNH